jgi:hypothetical protein
MACEGIKMKLKVSEFLKEHLNKKYERVVQFRAG